MMTEGDTRTFPTRAGGNYYNFDILYSSLTIVRRALEKRKALFDSK